MKSETVVDVESVDSDLLYLLLQHIYSQNSGAVFRVSFVFFLVKKCVLHKDIITSCIFLVLGYSLPVYLLFTI